MFAILSFILTGISFILPAQGNTIDPARGPVLTLTNPQESYPVATYAEILVDARGGLSLEDVLSPVWAGKFSPLAQVGKPPLAPAYWLRLRIRDTVQPASRWLLLYDNYRINQISLYTPIPGSPNYRSKTTGNMYAFSSRDLAYRTYAFNLPTVSTTTDSSTPETVYIHLADVSGNISFTPLKILSLDQFSAQSNHEYFMLGAYYFSIVTALVFCAFYMFSLRERMVRSYLAFLLASIFLAISNDGIGHQYLWPNWPQFATMSELLSALIFQAVLLNFIINILKVDAFSRRWTLFLRALVGLFILLFFLRLIPIFNNPTVFSIIGLVLLIGLAMPFVTSLVMFNRQRATASLLLLAVTPYLADTLFEAFKVITRTEFTLPTGTSKLALFWIMAVFAGIINYRIVAIRRDHEQDQAELIAQQKEALRIEVETARVMKEARDSILVSYDTTLEAWAWLLELRDKETEGHSRRVTDLAMEFAKALGLSDEELVHIRRGALLHDIGKISIPDSILLKAGKLEQEEWEVMRQHPVYAHKVLEGIPFLKKALDIPVYHHEHWDGSGYPYGLKGEGIPLAARIFTIVDIWEALSSNRPYRKAWPKEQVIAYLRANAGVIFDPVILEKFIGVIARG